ncbi:hypothetical protein EHS25_001847 [Saitozyma podzolica]|jgi:hypothetical protein|uniref:Telomere-associated protein Rif1 N-terminal domain-containing protein n=1 Tax=Saitozyma podzolica TaxID=1890683 RepID=A0A427YFB1_9TREE|nr:hypothetical protein EHS25_001750 [Saitozyma podzolica]RSH89861.1 hypothetical protein EHS25_001847 [Saitozyma podzolica]
MVEALGTLSARPPTPPRTTTQVPSIDEKGRPEEHQTVFQTPGDSSFSTNGSTGALSSRRSKRVNFSPWTKYIKPPTFNSANSKSHSDLKVLPPSNECKPSKSILKTTHSPVPVSFSDVAPYNPDSFAMLLEPATQQLAGESLSSRLDAYMQLLGALKAYEGFPGAQEIEGKLGLITQFIQRDVSRDLENGGPLDTNIVIHALKLSIALVWHPDISGHLSDEFKIFLVDRSINCLQNAKVPKSILTHHMHILSTQNFNAKVMSNARLTRLLAVLHE